MTQELLLLRREKTKDSKKQQEDEEKKGNKSSERAFHCEMETLGSKTNPKKRLFYQVLKE